MPPKTDLSTLPDSVFTSLLHQGISLGHFHSSSPISMKVEQDGLETYEKIQRDGPVRFSRDIDCQLIFCQKTGICYTREALINEMIHELDRVGGRASKNYLYQTLNIETLFLEPGSPILKLLPKSVLAMDTELISECFWAKLQRDVSREVQENGVLDMLKLANQNALKMELFSAKVVSKVGGVTLHGQELASNDYVEKLRYSIVQHFQSLKEPVVVAKVCSEYSWNVRLALDWLLQEIKKEKIRGRIHADDKSMNITTATFTPSTFIDLQHFEATKFLEENGFITKARASRHGLSLFKIEQLAKDNHEDLLLLDDILIIEDDALQKLQVAIHLCTETGTVDLGEYIPDGLIRRDIILELLGRANVPSGLVVFVISDGRAMLVSQSFQDEVRDTVVLPLVQSFAKARAEEIMKEKRKNEITGDDDDITSSHREKKNKSKSRKNKEKPTGKYADVVSLQHVAQKVIDQFPVFFKLDAAIEDIECVGGGFSWDDEDDSGYLLIEFCKCVLYTDAFRSQCHSALRAELKRLESVKMSKARISRKEAATKLRDVDSAFEDSFIDLCYLIQISTKFLLFASGCNDVFDAVILNELQNELLLGYCADLTSRITQYCLYKYDEEHLFTFSRKTGEKVEEKTANSSLPSFCEEVDSSAMRPYLSCPPPRDPLPVLRECLDGNKGVILARQWILCGGESYRGGVRISEEGGEVLVREGSIDGFLIHVKDNCLTLCGLPFKKLEKKAEKRLLFRRRKALSTLLQQTKDPSNVLDLTIMILYMQVKHLIVHGKHLRGAILDSLVQERKISDGVAAVLKGLKTKVEKGLPVAEDYLKTVRDCGLCKDIGKHDVDCSIE